VVSKLDDVWSNWPSPEAIGKVTPAPEEVKRRKPLPDDEIQPR
jgi:hypothetical protein